jgi:hypothetical protein
VPPSDTASVGVPPRKATGMRHLLTYDEIAPLTRDRRTGRPLDVQTLRKLQRDARRDREVTVTARLAMPEPVQFRPNPVSANLPDQPLFDGVQIREWLERTDRLAPFLRYDPASADT